MRATLVASGFGISLEQEAMVTDLDARKPLPTGPLGLRTVQDAVSTLEGTQGADNPFGQVVDSAVICNWWAILDSILCRQAKDR